MAALPVIKPVGDTGVLLEFGDAIDPALFDRILALDAALAADPPPGLCETVPAYVTLLLVYDPLVTDAAAIAAAALALAVGRPGSAACRRGNMSSRCAAMPIWRPISPKRRSGWAWRRRALLDAHLAAEYRVYMYGFAPGYAYMDGVPAALHLPRKAVPVRSRPVGTIMIAGGQCLITTLPMPTGWWVIGQTSTPVLRLGADEPFLFQPGDRVRFRSVSRAEFDAG